MLRRLATLLLALGVLVGCGEEAAGEGTAHLWVTRDRGASAQGRRRDALRRPLRPRYRRDRGQSDGPSGLVFLRERLRGGLGGTRVQVARRGCPVVRPPLLGWPAPRADRRRRLPGAVPSRLRRPAATRGRRSNGHSDGTGARKARAWIAQRPRRGREQARPRRRVGLPRTPVGSA